MGRLNPDAQRAADRDKARRREFRSVVKNRRIESLEKEVEALKEFVTELGLAASETLRERDDDDASNRHDAP